MSVIEGQGVQRKLHLRLPSESHQHVSRVPLGTTFQKYCGREGMFVGTIIAFDPVQDLYQVPGSMLSTKTSGPWKYAFDGKTMLNSFLLLHESWVWPTYGAKHNLT